MNKTIKILATSDLHSGGIAKLDVTGANMLLLAGDISPDGKWNPTTGRRDWEGCGSKLQWLEQIFFPWCKQHSQLRIVLTLGNRDRFVLEKPVKDIQWPENVVCLIDEMKVVDGLRIYGTPWVTIKDKLLKEGRRGDGEFEVEPIELKEKFAKIPTGLDILLCHATPSGCDTEIDLGYDKESKTAERYGSTILEQEIRRAKPKIVVCGHIHALSHRIAHLMHEPDGLIVNVSRVTLNDRKGVESVIEPRVIEGRDEHGEMVLVPVRNPNLDGHQFQPVFTAESDDSPFENDTQDDVFFELEQSVLCDASRNYDEMDRRGSELVSKRHCSPKIYEANWPEWMKIQAALMEKECDRRAADEEQYLLNMERSTEFTRYGELDWSDYGKGPGETKENK